MPPKFDGPWIRSDPLMCSLNNAGIALYDDLSDPLVLEKHLAVTYSAPYALIQAFLPMLIRSHGGGHQQSVGQRTGAVAADPRVLDLKSGRVQPYPVATGLPGSRGCTGSRGSRPAPWTPT